MAIQTIAGRSRHRLSSRFLKATFDPTRQQI